MSRAAFATPPAALAAAAVVALAAFGGSSPSARSEGSASIAALTARALTLERDIASLEDEKAVEKLQRIYGFYTDKQLWTQAADLFAADGTIEVGARGVYVGKDRVLAFLKQNGPEFPQPGRLFDQMQLQPVVHVAEDGRTAKGRWHMFAQEAVHGEYAHWGLGTFENEYVKEGGVWKIQRLHLYTTMYTTYEDGWAKVALANEGPSSTLPPDRPPSVEYKAFPTAFVPPLHYDNPVTSAAATPVRASGNGARSATQSAVLVAEDSQAGGPAAPSPAALGSSLDALEHRLGLLEDLTQLERMNSIYGYYLAHLQWDDLTGIFAPTGTIEIAMRGVYAGSASVRRNLNLYGQATDSQFGLQHNHMQFQPVIDVAPDGQSAKMRSRALSIMGQWQRYSQWMGGVYENEYVKESGVWKIKHDQVFNTYFVPYTVGWRTVMPRLPPGITDTNPPDAPPTHPFEMYPKPFLPPFHYPNPVTGATVSWTPPQ